MYTFLPFLRKPFNISQFLKNSQVFNFSFLSNNDVVRSERKSVMKQSYVDFNTAAWKYLPVSLRHDYFSYFLNPGRTQHHGYDWNSPEQLQNIPGHNGLAEYSGGSPNKQGHSEIVIRPTSKDCIIYASSFGNRTTWNNHNAIYTNKF